VFSTDTIAMKSKILIHEEVQDQDSASMLPDMFGSVVSYAYAWLQVFLYMQKSKFKPDEEYDSC
jgi:hypothetical protein